jgi:site-specific recombinase
MGDPATIPRKDLEQPRNSLVSARLLARLKAFSEARYPRSRYEALIKIIQWLQRMDVRRGHHAELDGLVEYLETNEPARLAFQTAFGAVLQDLQSLTLLAETGIPSDQGLIAEVVQRLVSKVIPMARRATDSSRLLINLYSTKQQVRQFKEIPGDLFLRLVAVVTPEASETAWEHERRDLCEALRLLATRVGWLGLKPEMRERSVACGISDSPFYELVQATEQLLGPNGAGGTSAWQEVVGRCRQELGAVHRHMEAAGVSVELVFDLKKIEACFARMESLVAVLCASNHADGLRATRHLLESLMEGRQSDLSLTALLKENLDLVARKTVERTGHSGEHYIAHDRSEYWEMWRAAIGGGLLTVVTAALKMRIVDAHLPPFLEGLASGTNYAVSFVFLQVFGFVLATKQPAATAATFAGIVRDNRGAERSNKIADFVSHITSTQFAAALGNVVAVAAGSIVFDRLWRLLFTQSFLMPKSAEHVYEMLNPLHSATAFYAIVTGIILWLAALAGGWCENFATYYRITDAVAEHPVGTHVGQKRTASFADALEKNLGGWSTSIVLGYLLGFAPVIGYFFGVPLDVRHVTLSSGTLALAAAQSGREALVSPSLYYAMAGIGVVFVLNLFVSFTIAGIVALQAYDVSMREQFAILGHLFWTGLRSPLRFILPPRSDQEPGAESRVES